MSEATEEKKESKQCKHSYSHHGEASAVYGMGLTGFPRLGAPSIAKIIKIG